MGLACKPGPGGPVRGSGSVRVSSPYLRKISGYICKFELDLDRFLNSQLLKIVLLVKGILRSC